MSSTQHTTEHPDPKFKKANRTKPGKIRESTGDNRDAVAEDIGKSLLVLLTTPLALAGVGQVLGGVGSNLLRGLGKVVNRPRKLVGCRCNLGSSTPRKRHGVSLFLLPPVINS